MIDADALRKQAANKYPEIVVALLHGQNPFPLKLRYPRIKTTDSRESILADIETLQSLSRERRDGGLTIDWVEIDTARYGRNRVPGDISLVDESDYMSFVAKQGEMLRIRAAANTLANAFPGIASTLPNAWRLLRDGGVEFWQAVIKVVAFFQQSPLPDRYIRELSIEVPTKFIEENRSLLEHLVREAAPNAYRADGETFEERLGLKTPDALIECRLLDDHLAPGWKFRQFTVSLKDLNNLGELPAHTILITENRTNFLTLPNSVGVVAIQGQGYAVSRLRRVPFLRNRRILYWGDLDAQGFEILAVLRREFPQTESLMMDKETWEQFAAYRVNGVRSRSASAQFLPQLQPAEAALFEVISSQEMRLEQERIPQDYANKQINLMIQTPDLNC